MNKIFISCENINEFKSYEKEGTKGVKITGKALPFNSPSRNGVIYTEDSIKKQYKNFVGKPFLFNHDDRESRGHITKTWLSDNYMWYEADLDPEEKDFIRKLKRGDIPYVSIQIMYDNPTEVIIEDTSYVEVDITDVLEISAVSIPGFADTSVSIVESFKNVKEQDNMSENKDDRIDIIDKKLDDIIELLSKKDDDEETDEELDDDEETDEDKDEDDEKDEDKDEDDDKEEAVDEDEDEDEEQEEVDEDDEEKEKLKEVLDKVNTSEVETSKTILVESATNLDYEGLTDKQVLKKKIRESIFKE